VKRGDQVVTRYREALVVRVKKPGEVTPGVAESAEVTRAAPGEKPGGTLTNTATIVVTVDSIDRANQSVVLVGPGGAIGAGRKSRLWDREVGVFAPGASQLLGPGGPDRLIVTDSILPTRIGQEAGAKPPVVLPASTLFAEAIRRICDGGSVVALRELEPRRR